MKKIIYLLVFIGSFTACNNQTKQAQALFDGAKSYYERKEFASAKLLLDSLKNAYPQEIEIQKEALQLTRNVDLSEQERNLAFCDSLLSSLLPQAEEMKKQFTFEKTEYDEIGKFIPKQQKVENNLQKSYVRSGVNELGEMYIASVFYGANPINHNRMKVSTKNGMYAETEIIPRDGGLNYTFKDLGMTTEIVTYKQGKDNGVIAFIVNNQKEAIKATFIGNKEYSLSISNSDKKAILESSELSILLSDIEKTKKEITKAQARIEYLKTKIL